jgi:hypothetical protein
MKVTTRGTPVTLTRPDGQRLLLSSGSVHGIPADFEAVARASLLLRVDESDQPTHHESGEAQPAGTADETPPARQRKEKK